MFQMVHTTEMLLELSSTLYKRGISSVVDQRGKDSGRIAYCLDWDWLIVESWFY